MKIAILLYGMFRHPDAAIFWKYMMPPGDIFVFATYTPNPKTVRSHDKPISANATYPGINRASYWSILDQDTYDRSIGLNEMVKTRLDPWTNTTNKTSLQNAIRVLFQLESLRNILLSHDNDYTHRSSHASTCYLSDQSGRMCLKIQSWYQTMRILAG